jgi:predicted O-linked N-acetylglucosamine transferase (SPINDLY family)
MFRVWMRLLARLEESVLWLSRLNGPAMQNLRSEANEHGIDPERIVFAPWVATDADHLARHRLADVFLDTLPFNAHTTASDALWAGLPVLTCPGETFAGRVATSLLNAVGLPELVTRSIDEYEPLAFFSAVSRRCLIRASALPPIVVLKDASLNVRVVPIVSQNSVRGDWRATLESEWAGV